MDNIENQSATVKKYWSGPHFWIKILIALILLIVVFKAGVMIGEIRGELGLGHRGSPMMRGGMMFEGDGFGNNVFFQKRLDTLPPINPNTQPTTPSSGTTQPTK